MSVTAIVVVVSIIFIIWYLAEESKRRDEIARIEEEQRMEEIRRAEEARIAEEERQAEQARREEEARRAEEERREAEARRVEEARRAEEERRMEEARRAEEERLAEEARKAEEERKAEELRRAEEERLAEEARRAEEEALRATVTDIDGNVYQLVKIGTQEWMADNLRVTRYLNGDRIPNITDSTEWSNHRRGAWSYYDNDASNDSPYGKLYNWYAVADRRGICTEGWRVPDDDDWATLENYLGGRSVAGGKMKTEFNWGSPNTGATNESGWSGLPGGVRNDSGSFANFGFDGYWWDSTELTAYIALIRSLSYDSNVVSKSIKDRRYGLSVRCISE